MNHPRRLLIALLLIGLTLLGYLLTLRPGPNENQPGSPSQVAIDSARAFYSVDYRDRAAWLDAMKTLSTEDGYVLLETAVAPTLWPTLEEHKTVTTADQVEVADQGLVLEGESEIAGPWQIRLLGVHIAPDALWPAMQTAEFPAYVLLGQMDGEWRFGSFLTQQQVAIFEQGAQ